jgi:hypothetical protein
MLLRLPGVRLHPFVIDTSELPDLDGPAEAWHAAVGVSPSMATSMLLLVDPSSQDLNDLISGLDYAYPQTIKLGGIAGQHSAPHGSLLLDDGVRSGAIGCLIGGAWRLDPVLAQGCRPIGPVMEVEQAQRNVVLQVSTEGERQRSPVEALQAILTHLSPAEREQVRHSLFLGVGRNDFRLSPTLVEPSTFLVRNLLGVDPRNGAVAVGERMRAQAFDAQAFDPDELDSADLPDDGRLPATVFAGGALEAPSGEEEGPLATLGLADPMEWGADELPRPVAEPGGQLERARGAGGDGFKALGHGGLAGHLAYVQTHVRHFQHIAAA